MLVVSVELHPGGNAYCAKELGRMVIGNVSELADVSDYIVLAKEGDNPLTGAGPQDDEFKIDGFDRKQSVWAIVERASRMAAAAFTPW